MCWELSTVLWEWGPCICMILFWRIWCLGQIFLHHASFVPKTIIFLKKYDGVLISKFWENLWWSSNFGLIKKCLQWKIMHLNPIFFLNHIQALLTKKCFWPKLGSNLWPLDIILPSNLCVVRATYLGPNIENRRSRRGSFLMISRKGTECH